MPIHLSYDSKLDAMDIRIEGIVQYRHIEDLLVRMLAHPAFRPDIRQIFDTTSGGLDLSQSDLENIARMFTAKEDHVGRRRRFALIAARDVDYGQLRMYDVFFERDPGVKMKIFRDREEACRWLTADGPD